MDNPPDYMESTNSYFKDEQGKFIGGKLRITASFQGTEATKISINLNAPAGFHLEKNVINYDKLSGKGTPIHFETNILVRNDSVISKNIIDLTACYDIMVESNNQTSVTHESVLIPLWAYTRLVPPQKDATYKIMIDISEKPPGVLFFPIKILGRRALFRLHRHPKAASGVHQ